MAQESSSRMRPFSLGMTPNWPSSGRGMATNKNPLKGLHIVKAKGRTYHYAWRGGPQIKADPGNTKEFLEEFLAAKSPHIDGARFGGWVQKYKASEDYKAISDKTKSNWGPILDEI